MLSGTVSDKAETALDASRERIADTALSCSDAKQRGLKSAVLLHSGVLNSGAKSEALSSLNNFKF